MRLTIFDLKDLKKHCDEFSDCVSEILKEKYSDTSDKPFNSLSDYEKAVSNVSSHPENYYKVQIFDKMTYITYHKPSGFYHIVVRGFYPDCLNKYKRVPNSTDCYVINSDLSLTLDVWYDVIFYALKTLRPQQEFIF